MQVIIKDVVGIKIGFQSLLKLCYLCVIPHVLNPVGTCEIIAVLENYLFSIWVLIPIREVESILLVINLLKCVGIEKHDAECRV